jgi:murein DD-endopeptidase MepM/ murein hydrolase activator NlpD
MRRPPVARSGSGKLTGSTRLDRSPVTNGLGPETKDVQERPLFVNRGNQGAQPAPRTAMPNYVWPLSGTTSAPDMNTSFGPRINRNRWDFHDGIDLKAPIGTPVLAMRAGKVHRAGSAGTHGFSSRHVVLKVDDPNDGVMYG